MSAASEEEIKQRRREKIMARMAEEKSDEAVP
jgi:hypothetical protein